MEKRIIELYRRKFDDIRHEEDGIEYWYARELMTLLDYIQWRNFENVVKKGMLSCKNNGISVEDHFAGVSKMVTLGSGANREVEDYMLTRYACYLIAQNGDPRKEEIAFAQSYFAVQTRKQELIEEKDLQGESAITSEHVQNNQSVRNMLGSRRIKPEELPPSEDIKKLERRVKSQEKKLVQNLGNCHKQSNYLRKQCCYIYTRISTTMQVDANMKQSLV